MDVWDLAVFTMVIELHKVIVCWVRFLEVLSDWPVLIWVLLGQKAIH